MNTMLAGIICGLTYDEYLNAYNLFLHRALKDRLTSAAGKLRESKEPDHYIPARWLKCRL